MKLYPDEHETIVDTARRLRSGETTCVEVLQRCLDLIDEKEEAVRAWVLVDRDGAMDRARALDEELKAGHDRSPLHGIPVGIKDIIDVDGMPTGCGSPRATGRPALKDATIVSRLREAGAVILGKTVTTAYAWIDPPVTRNPWNPTRTPGGSSSGSAAAVACGMCLGAVGTQTGGSINRPAAFCGVAGMKPTFGHVRTTGVFPFAPSLDHPGPLARSVDDLMVLYLALCEPEHRVEKAPAGPLELEPSITLVGRLCGFFDDRAHSEMRWAMRAFLNWFDRAGGVMNVDRDSPGFFDDLLRCHRTIMAAEACSVHHERFSLLPEAYPLRITELIVEGSKISSADVELARGLKVKFVSKALELMKGLDALVAPAATGPAPDRSSTGDPAFNSPWSYLGFPTVSFPVGYSAERLPLAVQLIGRPGTDLELLRLAKRLEHLASSAHSLL